MVAPMATRSDDALATILLTNHLIEAAAPPLGAKEFWTLAATADPGALLGRSSEQLAGDVGVEPEAAERLARLLERATAVAFELERMEREGFAVLTPFDQSYPSRVRERLGTAAPPLLYAVGRLELLQAEGIGIVGSRDVSPDGVAVAEAAARAAAEGGLTVISGGARGVDQRSMAAAYAAGGSVVGYLAESLEGRVKDPDTRRVIGEGMVCLTTPTNPSAGFSVANAMNRNKLVYASARATLVVATDEGRGGTWEGAVESMRRGFGPVAVWKGVGEGQGNAALAAKGATEITEISSLFELRSESNVVPPQDPQLALDV
jgi:predicted Rossmann fold nucleotide-binding protein DprA/Smf involved in DNA uptake